MLRLVALASLLTAGACRIELESDTQNSSGDDGSNSGMACKVSMTAPTCLDAPNHSDLTWLQTNVFTPQCTFSGCHNGENTDAGKVDMRAGMTYAHLVGYTSHLDSTRKLVVASDSASSYLLFMLQKFPASAATPPASPPPDDIGFMPQNSGGATLCCQKLDAIDRWIAAGAMND
jgi:hypothetical protein